MTRNRVVALSALVVLATAVAAQYSMAPRRPKMAAKPNVVVGAPVPLYHLDIASPAQVAAILAVMRSLDAQFGYPKLSTNADGTPAVTTMITWVNPALGNPIITVTPVNLNTHKAIPHPHPTQPGRWEMPFDPDALAAWPQYTAVCANAVGPCAPVAQMPAPIAALDPTWATVPDAGVTPWYCGDGGCIGNAPPLPTDGFPGVTILADGGLLQEDAGLTALDSGLGGIDSGAVGLDAGHVGRIEAGVQAPKL